MKCSRNAWGNIQGEVVNGLTVMRHVGFDKYGHARWECRCKCGGTTEQRASDIMLGKVKSCGKCGKENHHGA